MNINKWLQNNTTSLNGKVVAITGSTGGLGSALCWHLAKLGATILTLDRNPQKSIALKNSIVAEFPNVNFDSVKLDLGSIADVKSVCAQLAGRKIDYLILNAGVYNVPLADGDSGYNNIFQVNFVSHYLLVKELLPTLQQNRAKVVTIGSIAHKYAKLQESDVDYSHAQKSSKIYGNAKRFIMFSLYELLQGNPDVSYSVAHPGITLTNMTNHYPKAINWFVKFGVKLFFPSPKQAALSALSALYVDCGYRQWIGPSHSNIWGKPKITKLNTCSPSESKRIFEIAEQIYNKLYENQVE